MDATVNTACGGRRRTTFRLAELFFYSEDKYNKKAQLSLTNPRDAKACQKLLRFDVITTLSLTILVYLHSFNCWSVRNLRNSAKFSENSKLWSGDSEAPVAESCVRPRNDTPVEVGRRLPELTTS